MLRDTLKKWKEGARKRSKNRKDLECKLENAHKQLRIANVANEKSWMQLLSPFTMLAS